MTTLYGRRQEKITLDAAIAACQQCFKEAVGLFYSPERCFLSQVKGTAVTDSSGQPSKLNRVFEARIFNANYELRWLNQTGGEGIAVLLSELPNRKSGCASDRDSRANLLTMGRRVSC